MEVSLPRQDSGRALLVQGAWPRIGSEVSGKGGRLPVGCVGINKGSWAGQWFHLSLQTALHEELSSIPRVECTVSNQ